MGVQIRCPSCEKELPKELKPTYLCDKCGKEISGSHVRVRREEITFGEPPEVEDTIYHSECA